MLNFLYSTAVLAAEDISLSPTGDFSSFWLSEESGGLPQVEIKLKPKQPEIKLQRL
jgi:hypothetical protein